MAEPSNNPVNRKAYDFALILKPAKLLKNAIDALSDPTLNPDKEALIQVTPITAWNVDMETGNEIFVLLCLKANHLEGFQCNKPLRKMLPLTGISRVLRASDRFLPESVAIFLGEGSDRICTSALDFVALGLPVHIDLENADENYEVFPSVGYIYETVVPSNGLTAMMTMLPPELNNGAQCGATGTAAATATDKTAVASTSNAKTSSSNESRKDGSTSDSSTSESSDDQHDQPVIGTKELDDFSDQPKWIPIYVVSGHNNLRHIVSFTLDNCSGFTSLAKKIRTYHEEADETLAHILWPWTPLYRTTYYYDRQGHLLDPLNLYDRWGEFAALIDHVVMKDRNAVYDPSDEVTLRIETTFGITIWEVKFAKNVLDIYGPGGFRSLRRVLYFYSLSHQNTESYGTYEVPYEPLLSVGYAVYRDRDMVKLPPPEKRRDQPSTDEDVDEDAIFHSREENQDMSEDDSEDIDEEDEDVGGVVAEDNREENQDMSEDDSEDIDEEDEDVGGVVAEDNREENQDMSEDDSEDIDEEDEGEEMERNNSDGSGEEPEEDNLFANMDPLEPDDVQEIVDSIYPPYDSGEDYVDGPISWEEFIRRLAHVWCVQHADL